MARYLRQLTRTALAIILVVTACGPTAEDSRAISTAYAFLRSVAAKDFRGTGESTVGDFHPAPDLPEGILPIQAAGWLENEHPTWLRNLVLSVAHDSSKGTPAGRHRVVGVVANALGVDTLELVVELQPRRDRVVDLVLPTEEQRAFERALGEARVLCRAPEDARWESHEAVISNVVRRHLEALRVGDLFTTAACSSLPHTILHGDSLRRALPGFLDSTIATFNRSTDWGEPATDLEEVWMVLTSVWVQHPQAAEVGDGVGRQRIKVMLILKDGLWLVEGLPYEPY